MAMRIDFNVAAGTGPRLDVVDASPAVSRDNSHAQLTTTQTN
jgi:hypothetical protein